MKCIRCNEPETRKISSLYKVGYTGIFYRRRCFSCGFRFITWQPDKHDGLGEEFHSEMKPYNFRKDDKNRTRYFK